MARYQLEGEAAFEPLSRAPSTSPNATPVEPVELVLRLRKQLTNAGLDAGADTIGWHLTHHHATTVSRATINRILTRAGAVTPEPKKRPKTSYLRFEAEQPNQTWQSDFTHYRLQDGTRHVTHRGGIRRVGEGTDVEILTWLDDCSRYALSVTAHRPVTGPVVLATFRKTAASYGFGIHADRQRPCLHRPTLRRHSWPQPPRARAPRAQHHAEERQTEPSADPRQGRAVPADPEEVATGPTPTAHHPRRAADPAR